MPYKQIFVAACLTLAFLAAALCAFIFWYFRAGAEALAGYGAKIMATGIFVAERSPESIASQELALLPFLEYRVDREERTVTAWIRARYPKTAVYREGLGVALAQDGNIKTLQDQALKGLQGDLDRLKTLPWPMGDAPSGNPRPGGIDEEHLSQIVNGMFTPPTRFLKRHTRAVVVVYNDEIIAEQYAEGFTPQQRFAGWSMTKSIFHALCGIAVRQGKLSIKDPVPFWAKPDDPRSAITIDMLLRMSSGLDYNEFDALPPPPLATMLFLQPGAGTYALTLPLRHAPDTIWAYASASTNILSRILRQAYGDEEYHALPYRELFSRIGMRSALIEADAEGTFVGSSFMHATARDYARFGLLYQHDGIWQGERILPEGWVEYGRTPTPTAPDGHYGAHWWRPSDSERADAAKNGVSLPADMFFASGFEWQNIVVIPSRNLVIVLLNLDLLGFSPIPFTLEVLNCLPNLPG